MPACFGGLLSEAKLTLGLELVVSELAARLGERLTFLHRSADPVFNRIDFFGDFQNLLFMRARDNHDTIRVTSQNIPRMDARVSDVDGPVGSLHLDAVLARAHGIAAAVDRIAEFERERHVAARAVDYRAGDTVAVGDPSEN